MQLFLLITHKIRQSFDNGFKGKNTFLDISKARRPNLQIEAKWNIIKTFKHDKRFPKSEIAKSDT